MESKPKSVLYKIHNVVRDQATKLTRTKQPRRPRMTLLLAGGVLRIQRGRYQVVTEALVRQLAPALIAAEKAGSVKVTTMGDQRVDIDTLQPLERAAAPAALKKAPLDSAANDQSFASGVGEGKPTMPGGKALSQELPVPAILPPQMSEAEEEAAEEADQLSESTEAEEEAAEEADQLSESTEVAEEAAPVTVDPALTEAVYNSGTAKELTAKALELGLSVEGNKRDVAGRLAAAGYVPGA